MTCKDCIGYEFCSIGRDEDTIFYGKDIACNAVEDLCPTFKNKADFVEVVRCKDCAYYVPLGDNYEYKGKKAMHCILRASCTGDNYYCADGMRKEKDNG